MEIENVGRTPAYNLGVSRVLCRGTPLPNRYWTKHVNADRRDVAPAERTIIAIEEDLYKNFLSTGECRLEVTYFNRYNEWRSFVIAFYRDTPIIVFEEEELPGFLLSIPTYVHILRAQITLLRFGELAIG